MVLRESKNRKRMYQGIWELIAKNTSDQPVKVNVPISNHRRVIQAVRKEKAIANMTRKNVDAVSYGDLIVTKVGRELQFKLEWNGDMI